LIPVKNVNASAKPYLAGFTDRQGEALRDRW
jgi:hypothetical protein